MRKKSDNNNLKKDIPIPYYYIGGTFYSVLSNYIIKKFPTLYFLGKEVDIGIIIVPLTMIITAIAVNLYYVKKLK